jgi:hypothetical protein
MVGGLLDVEDLEEGLLRADPTDVEMEEFVREITRQHEARLTARERTRTCWTTRSATRRSAAVRCSAWRWRAVRW